MSASTCVHQKHTSTGAYFVPAIVLVVCTGLAEIQGCTLDGEALAVSVAERLSGNLGRRFADLISISGTAQMSKMLQIGCSSASRHIT